MDGKRIPKAVREAVEARDAGRCALCGADCFRIAEIVDATVEHLADLQSFWRRSDHRIAVLKLFGAPKWRKNFYDLDHRTPETLGGPATVENLRTLCCWCHGAVTRAQQPVFAKVKRLAKKAVFEQIDRELYGPLRKVKPTWQDRQLARRREAQRAFRRKLKQQRAARKAAESSKDGRTHVDEIPGHGVRGEVIFRRAM